MSKIEFLKKKDNFGKVLFPNFIDGREIFEHKFSTISIITSLIFFFFDEWLNNGNLCSSFVQLSCAVKDNTIVHKSCCI